MDPTVSHPDEFAEAAELISLLCEERLSPDGAARLEALVMSDVRIRRLYVREVHLHAELYECANHLGPSLLDELGAATSPRANGEDATRRTMSDAMVLPALREESLYDDDDHDDDLAAAPRVQAPRAVRRLSRSWAAAAAVALVGLTALVFLMSSEGPAPTATLASVVQARWEGAAPSVGSGLDPRSEYRLRSGLARLAFDGGVDVIIEGPSRFACDARGHVRLEVGRLTATVPVEGRGFTVATPVARVVDLGTEFGVAVDPAGGRTDAAVFRGTVEVDVRHGGNGTSAPPPTRLAAGQAARVVAAAGGTGRATVARLASSTDAGPFVRAAEMDLRARAARGSDHDAKLVAALELARDPAVVAYALFDAEADAALQRAGMPRSMPLRTGGNVPAFGPRVAPGPRGETRAPVGGSLTTDGESLVFAHLDASAGSSMAGRGLHDAHGMVGADGTTLYVSWIMKGASQGQGFAGFSLFAGDKHEPLFVGRTNFGTPNYACPVYGRGADRAQIVDRLVDADVARPGVQPLAVTEQPHLWVMKIEFRPGPDVVSVFVDPADSIEPAAANLVVDELEIKFDRLRLGSSDGVQWHFGRIILSNTFASAVR